MNANLLPGFGIVVETDTKENLLPGFGIANESFAAAAVEDATPRRRHVHHR